MSIKSEATIYTDGACIGNPGPGGWAAIVQVGGKEQELSGGEKWTTNNRMELLGVINGLKALRGPHIVTIYSDSRYITDAFNSGWLRNWKHNGWHRKDGKDVLNPDLWKELDALTQKHSCTFKWVKGHNGNPYNERCDRLAVRMSELYSKGKESESVAATDDTVEEICLDDAMAAMQKMIVSGAERKYGLQLPCGAHTFCDYCKDGQGMYPCAEACTAQFCADRIKAIKEAWG